MTTEKTDDQHWDELYKQAVTHSAESDRLKYEIVRAARAWLRGEISEGELRTAVIALEQFESNDDTVEEHA